jgi:hypothetical protein
MERLVFWLAKLTITILDLFEPQGLEFYIFKKDWHDYLAVRLNAPLVVISDKQNIEDGNEFIFKVSLDTCILFTRTEIFKNFKLKVLGFGFEITRQQGY